MAQHDYSLADAAGLAFRGDLNNVLAAIISQNSATTEPTTTVAYMFWADTTTAILKQRNAGNSAWISLFNMTTGPWLGTAGTVVVADAAADTATWPMLATSQTGNQAPATDAGLTYNASTNVLGASISGNAATATNAIGYNQIWNSVGGSRAIGTEYTNSLNKPIEVIVSFASASLASIRVLIAGSGKATTSTNGFYNAVSFIVPAGDTYKILQLTGTTTIEEWVELY